jgi:hypothetical protein
LQAPLNKALELMIHAFLQRRANFKRLLQATQRVGAELEARGYGYWLSQAESTPEMHFHREIDGLTMYFDVDWYKGKDGSLFVDLVGSANLPTNFGVRPRYYFVLRPGTHNDRSSGSSSSGCATSARRST